MKPHKIRNIDIKVCSAEQKIAYNMAFSDYTFIERIQREYTQAAASEAAAKMRDIHIDKLKQENTKYDIDVIFCAYNAGIWDYIKAPYHILGSYEDVGKMFPIEY